MSASVVVRLSSLAIFEEAESILEALPDGLLVTDPRGTIMYANVRMEHLSGYDRRELVGTTVDSLVPEGLQATHHDQRERFSVEPKERPMGTGLETRLLRSDGTELPVEIQLSPAEIGGYRASWPRSGSSRIERRTSIRAKHARPRSCSSTGNRSRGTSTPG